LWVKLRTAHWLSELAINDHDQEAGDEVKKTPRIALGVLIGWTAAVVVLVITGALVAPHGNATEVSSWTGQDYRLLAAVLGGFLTWFLGLTTIALVTIVVRLGHLTGEPADAA